MLPLWRAQYQPQPDSPNSGVEVRGSQNAGRGIENVVRDNRGAQQPNGNTGVRISGNQAAVESIKNQVSGNVLEPPSPGFHIHLK